MATGKKPDPRRRQSKHPHASNLKVTNGGKEHAYLAGELFGCYGHRTHAQQPCVADLTNDELKCPYCAAGIPAVWRGYVPLWDRDWTLRYVLIGEDYFASVDTIKHGEQVELTRAKNPISPLVVRPGVGLFRKLPSEEPWSTPVSMLSICLTLWQCDALNLWYQRNPLKKVVSDNKPSLKSNGEPFGPMTSKAATKYGKGKEPVPLEDAAGDVFKNLAKRRDALKASENGNGKH